MYAFELHISPLYLPGQLAWFYSCIGGPARPEPRNPADVWSLPSPLTLWTQIILHYQKLAVQPTSCTACLLNRSGLFFRTGYNPSGYQKENKIENAWIKLSPLFPARIRELNQRYISFKTRKLHITSQSLYQFAFQTKQRDCHGHALNHLKIIFVGFPANCKPFLLPSHISLASNPTPSHLHEIWWQHRLWDYCASWHPSRHWICQRQDYLHGRETPITWMVNYVFEKQQTGCDHVVKH